MRNKASRAKQTSEERNRRLSLTTTAADLVRLQLQEISTLFYAPKVVTVRWPQLRFYRTPSVSLTYFLLFLVFFLLHSGLLSLWFSALFFSAIRCCSLHLALPPVCECAFTSFRVCVTFGQPLRDSHGAEYEESLASVERLDRLKHLNP